MMNRAAHKKVNSRKRHAQGEGDAPPLCARHILKAVAVTVGTGLLLIFALSLALYFSPNPSPMILPAGLVAAALTSLIGGFAAARIHGHGALLCGLINGTALLALMLLLSIPFARHASAYPTYVACLLHVAVPVLSVTGAYLGLRRTPKKKKRRH